MVYWITREEVKYGMSNKDLDVEVRVAPLTKNAKHEFTIKAFWAGVSYATEPPSNVETPLTSISPTFVSFQVIAQ